MEPKTLESQIKCHTERFPQWLISLSEKKSNKLCFSLFLLLDPVLRSLQSQGEPSTAVCRKPLCSGALCSVPGCSCLQRARKDNRKTSMPMGTSYRWGGGFSLYLSLHCVLRQQGFCCSVLCTAICIAWWLQDKTSCSFSLMKSIPCPEGNWGHNGERESIMVSMNCLADLVWLHLSLWIRKCSDWLQQCQN